MVNASKKRRTINPTDDQDCEVELQEHVSLKKLESVSQLCCLTSTSHRAVLSLIDNYDKKHACHKAKYYRKSPGGRLYARGVSLQSLSSWICRLVTYETGAYYWDLDFVNCGPTCLAYIYNTHLGGHLPPTLKWYIDSRSDVLNTLKCEYPLLRDASDKILKGLILSVMGGANIHKYLRENAELHAPDNFCIPQLTDLRDEIVAMNTRLCSTNPYYKNMWDDLEGKVDNVNGSFTAHVWQKVEAEALDLLREYLGIHCYRVRVLKFDGLLVDRLNATGPIPDELIQGAQDYVEAKLPGLGIRITEKSMTPTTEDLDKETGRRFTHTMTDEERAKYYTTQKGKEKCMRRQGDYCIEKHPSIPGVFTPTIKGVDFINMCCREQMKLPSMTRLKEWFECVDDRAFPILREDDLDKDVVSFYNGFINKTNPCGFTPWTPGQLSGTEASPLTDSFYEVDFDPRKSIIHATPLWDKMIDAQLEDVYPEDHPYAGESDHSKKELLEAMMGRVHFDVGRFDNWQVAPVIIGDANTGKSSVVNITGEMFPANTIGSLTSNFEKTFGLANIYNKRVVLAPDIPVELPKRLSAADFQSMISGDHMSIPVKGKPAINTTWTAPLLMAGNVVPDFSDRKGSIGRRILPIRFENMIQQRDTTLQRRIVQEELPYLMVRCLDRYRELVKDISTADFWSHMPDDVIKHSEDVRSETNPMTSFIRHGSDYYQITSMPGAQTSKDEFQRAFTNYMKYEMNQPTYVWKRDWYPVKSAGFSINNRQVCKVCSQSSNKRNCGSHYDRQNRTSKTFIVGMQIIKKKDRHQDNQYIS